MKIRSLKRDESGAAVIELAFALPALIIMLWALIQMGLVFRAMSGIQHALGQGARLATLYPRPDTATIESAINDAVYGIGPGEFDIVEPVEGTTDGSAYLDLQVTYTQPTDLLLLPGPTISVTRSKRVWVAEEGE